MPTIAQQNIFILGTAYCGSTLLGRALNNHSKVGYIGEFSRYEPNYNAYGLDHRSASCMHCKILQTDCPVFDNKFLSSAQKSKSAKTYDLLRTKLKKPILVDGSKHPAWLRIVQSQTPKSGIKAIILSRSPVDYLRSCYNRNINPLWPEANAWRDVYYDALRTCSQLNISYLTVRYEVFTEKPKQTLERICDFVGIEYNKSMLTKAGPLHAIGGNPGAYVGALGAGKLQNAVDAQGQSEIDINPAHLKSKNTKLSKAKLAELQQVAWQTPMLVDVANLLGYGTLCLGMK